MEIWKQIPINPKYEVSNFGNFRKKNPKNGYRLIKAYRKHNKFVVTINGKELTASRIVANAFVKQLVEGDVVFHKNGLENDNYYKNLLIVDRKYVGERTGHISQSRPVVEIIDNEIKRRWRSARQASKELFINRQTVSDYCNNRVKKKIFNLMWEDDYFDLVLPPFKWEHKKKEK